VSLADAAAAVAIDDAPRCGRKKGSKNKAAAAPVKKAGKRRPKAQAPDGVAGSLRGELAAIAVRFAPIDGLKRKLEVLDQLAQPTPGEVISKPKIIGERLSR
jgi:hypothetical protein